MNIRNILFVVGATLILLGAVGIKELGFNLIFGNILIGLGIIITGIGAIIDKII